MKRTRYDVSPWINRFPDSRRPNFPRLSGTLAADVVIVGAGLTGCATAYACASAGLKVLMLEAERIGQGGSGRSTGLILPEPGPAFRELAGAHGLRAARYAFDAWRRASLDAAALLRRLGITCGLDGRDLLTAVRHEDERALRREYETRQQAGLDVTWLSRTLLQKATPMEATGAMKMRDAFTVDPYCACLGLARAAAKRGARIFERSKVRRVRFTRKDAEVATGEAAVRTAAVVVTTGVATAEFHQLRRHFHHRETYLVLTEPMPASMRKALGSPRAIISDARMPRHHIRWTADDRLLISGGDQKETPQRTRKAVLVQRTGQLMYEVLTMYPAISGLMPEFGWQLTYGQAADGLPYIGPHRNFPHHYFALGGGDDSVTGAFLASRMLLRAIQKTPQKGDEAFAWLR